MRIFIALHMLVILYSGENERDRQYYYMMHSINYMIILFNWFIFENLMGVFKHPTNLFIFMKDNLRGFRRVTRLRNLGLVQKGGH